MGQARLAWDTAIATDSKFEILANANLLLLSLFTYQVKATDGISDVLAPRLAQRSIFVVLQRHRPKFLVDATPVKTIPEPTARVVREAHKRTSTKSQDEVVARYFKPLMST